MNDAESILPRELTDLPERIRSVPPPPIPDLPEPYGLRLAEPDADAEMIAEWMSRPHLVEAWESHWPVARWRRYLRAQLDGGFSRPLIATLDGTDRAYIEIYRAAKDSIARRYDHDPHDLGLHVAIADLDYIEHGHAGYLLPHLVISIFTLDPRCRRIMFDPDHRNALARKFCERGGCAFLGEHDMANRRMALYSLPRAPDDVPRTRLR
ncbi:GNAT family N-acetyltransferase [Mycobacterium marseillense]|uniref:Lysine N-acyltransferase MbtK n=1 Tax=Mycobacterium marseillense TaxID=701042 RepID=A0AAC9VVW5_9MYCO|nr:GNAT family N-acetyltransferase [Mycobacterium marseillense]ASW91564.1 N-acetyltransferase [Mycobacterium marseillense]MCA2263996.1 acetyltransferase [Mycobacterium marseillense]MDM3974673.1 GNAT family N-acetyltransferase [Mycobacterium marseillense]OBJ66947.1 siderophore biosynthesis protein [Mycobacterium marseillense]